MPHHLILSQVQHVFNFKQKLWFFLVAKCIYGFECVVFFHQFYLIALGTRDIKPCLSSFRDDQFNDTNPTKRKKKISLLNWFGFPINVAGALISCNVLLWDQDNVGWGWGFVIPTVFMGLAISLFFGISLYILQVPRSNPLTHVFQFIVALLHKFQMKVPQDRSMLYEVQDKCYVIKEV